MLPLPLSPSCHHALTMSPNDTAVTDDGQAPGPSRATGMKPNGEHVIRVQPLKRSEMQVRGSHSLSICLSIV